MFQPAARAASASPTSTRKRPDAQRRGLVELGVEAKTVDGIGDPGRMIVKVAEANDADLIVVGSHTAGALERFFVGRACSDSVKHHAACDVLVVR